jgi:hypothetical protein
MVLSTGRSPVCVAVAGSDVLADCNPAAHSGSITKRTIRDKASFLFPSIATILRQNRRKLNLKLFPIAFFYIMMSSGRMDTPLPGIRRTTVFRRES